MKAAGAIAPTDDLSLATLPPKFQRAVIEHITGMILYPNCGSRRLTVQMILPGAPCRLQPEPARDTENARRFAVAVAIHIVAA